MKLFISKFRLLGVDKNYEIPFKKGLNFISGPTSTGKTSILELINYALGAKSHKSYIEIEKKCTDIELEIFLDGTLFKLKRKLFEFNLPVSVQIFNNDQNKFIEYGIYNIEKKDNKESLSDFLLSKIGLSGVKITNQNLSFRDLFRYSYLKQIEIDNEDILSSQSNPFLNNKRKAAFEIIFNIYDQLLGELRKELKDKNDEYKEEKLRFEGIENFLRKSEIEDFDSVNLRGEVIENEISELKEYLLSIESFPEDTKVKLWKQSLQNKKYSLQKKREELSNQKQYISKLTLLKNQYENDIEKIDATIMGTTALNKYDFKVCPNCLKPITEHKNYISCSLCGNEMEELVENTVLLKKEKNNIQKNKNGLEKHILSERKEIEDYEQDIVSLERDIRDNEKILLNLTEKYINPYIEEISFINIELGRLHEEKNNLENSLRFIKELNRLDFLLLDKKNEILNLEKKIEEKRKINDKETTVENLSKTFENILIYFKFPKLENAYIALKDYLPYARERKYNNLGSLGAVSLITIAYYMSVLIESLGDGYNHLNLLMIDTPRKNLGSSSQNEEFQDEEIYNSVIRYMIALDQDDKLSNELQLIVINNGYPDFLPEENIVIEFSPDGKKGLIDDI